MKRIISALLIVLMLNSSITSCGSKRMGVSHFFNAEDSGADTDTETDGSIESPAKVDVVEEPGYDRRKDSDGNETHDYGGDEPGLVDFAENERGDAGGLTSDGSIETRSSGISNVTENEPADKVAEEKKNGQPTTGQGKDTRAEQDGVPFGPADPTSGHLTDRRPDGCTNCGGSEFGGASGTGIVKEMQYSSIEAMKEANTKQFERLRNHIRPASEGSSNTRIRLIGHAENLRNKHNETVERLKAKFAAENGKLASKVRFRTSEKSAIGSDIRDVAARFERTNNQVLKDTGNGLLAAADRAAYIGQLTTASAFATEAKKLSQAVEEGSLPSEFFDPNHKPDYNAGSFNETNEKIKAGRAAIDLYKTARELARDKSPAALAALGEAGTLLDIALGAARFSSIVDVPLSAMELFTGKTLEFDANGNPMIVEASTVTRAAAALTLGLTAAAIVTTGGLAAVGVAAGMAFVPGLLKAARKALGGLSKTEKAAETIGDIERTVEKIADSAKKIGMSKVDDVKAWASAAADLSESRLAKVISDSKRIIPGTSVQKITPDVIKFSQSKVNDAAELTASMRANGWVGEPIDIVKISDGTLVTADNTRVLAASRAGIDVEAIVRHGSEALPTEMVARFTTPSGVPRTWEEAVKFRIGNQNRTWSKQYPNGSYITRSDE